MKVTLTKSVAEKAIDAVERVSSGGTKFPGITFRASGTTVALVGVGHDTSIQVIAPASVSDEGETMLPAKLLSRIIKQLPEGTVTIQTTKDGVRVSAGNSKFNLRTLIEDGFPGFRAVEGSGVTVDAAELATGLGRVMLAASKDEARVVLGGVHFSPTETGMRLVATDSYRLALVSIDGVGALFDGRTVIVPVKALTELNRHLGAASGGVEALADDTRASFVLRQVGTESLDITLTTALINGEFPRFEHLIAGSLPCQATVSVPEIVAALKRVSLITRDGDLGARVTLGFADETTCGISARNLELGFSDDAVECAYSGEPIEISFNPVYLIPALEKMGTSAIISMMDSLKPALITSVEAPGYVYLIMPVRGS